MRRVAAALAGIGALALPTPAWAQVGDACTDAANVAWETNWDTATVEAAVVEVLGCADGSQIGLQLLTDDGDLPAEPLVGGVSDERVRFDLAPLKARIEPVIGVRVLLYGDPLVVAEITIEQRFFAQSGNEQNGLRRITELQVPVGGRYAVPDAPDRYRTVSCGGVRLDLGDDVVAQGAGTFTATTSGRHVVCYKQTPGSPGGPSEVEAPDVLDQTFPPAEEIQTPPGRSGTPLATTGANVAGLAVVAAALLLVGRRFVRTGG